MESRLNEPTTGEIVRDLRLKTEYGLKLTNGEFSEKDFVTTLAADRLESQERTIADKDAKIAALTARAESAERERDAAFDMLQDMRNCDECKHLARTWKEEPCNCCCREYSMFELCGLPQEGER